MMKSRLNTASVGNGNAGGIKVGEESVNRLAGVGNAVNWAVGAWGVTTLGAW